MLELMITSIPFVLRVVYLRRKGIPITLYNVHVSVFAWFALALTVFFAIFYYHPKSYSGLVPFRTVPVVSEVGGTVTDVYVSNGQQVDEGQLLFAVDNSTQLAGVETAEKKLQEVEARIVAAQANLEAANAKADSAAALFKQASDTLARQRDLQAKKSAAFRKADFDEAVSVEASRRADLVAAQASSKAVEADLTTMLPAKRETALATLEEARIALEKTTTFSRVSGQVQQLTLNVGARAGQFALSPAMVIIPDRPANAKKPIIAGFSQVARQVLTEGMAVEVACETNFNAAMTDVVLPARIRSIQEAIAAGQLAPSGRLFDPKDQGRPGDVLVYLELEHPEHSDRLMDGTACIVQAYTTHVRGALEGTFFSHAIEAMGVIKAAGLRIKVWLALMVGIGLGGGH